MTTKTKAKKSKAPKAPKTQKGTKAPGAKRTGSKQEKMIEMLRRPDGMTLDEACKAFDWQRHTVRGAMAGALKKKLGLKIESGDAERGRVYKIVD